MVIFLDIDGVLNQLQGRYSLDKNCIKNLALICNSLNGKIVLTSSWRLGYTNLGKCSPQIEKLKEYFDTYDINIVGRTVDLNDRTKEIEAYINKYEIKKYIILDDDKSEFKSGLLKNTYIINHKTGLTEKDAKKIVKEQKR